MKYLYLLAIIITAAGCAALSPVGPLGDTPSYNQRRPVPTQEYHLATQRTLATKDAQSGDIYMGMAAEGVRNSWGRPEEVEFAGHPSFGHQRWVYIKEIPTADGYLRQRRIVYFEQNRVVGWETQGL